MTIKINLPVSKNITDVFDISQIMQGTVYQNIKDGECYIYQNELNGHSYIIESHDFNSFETDCEARDFISENDLPDAWKETNLNFVVSLEVSK